MNTIDLRRVEAAMNWLADSAEGAQAVSALADACDTLQARIPTQLNNAEMRYVLERLMSQRDIYASDVGFTGGQVCAPAQAGQTAAQSGAVPYAGAAFYNPGSAPAYGRGYSVETPHQVGSVNPSNQLRTLARGFRVRVNA
ncbi:hypothetical protein K3720_00450 [Leisingera caerulea]|uniref:hypothetical protein n=1 Tax=Leisingera caerulea TaxID=506591 RepID=UPI0021A7F3D4|nr:hypothetical protein [Leisingera caerulea]UWQ49918.1 hypothetical protein K3720_00450 [Leisingera caerulea]